MLNNPLDQFIVDLIVKRKYQIQSDVLANKNVIINYYKKGFSLQILHQYLMDNKNLILIGIPLHKVLFCEFVACCP